MSIYDDKPAFPTTFQDDANGNILQFAHPGMSIKQYAALKMMTALIACNDSAVFSADELADKALEAADAVLRRT